MEPPPLRVRNIFTALPAIRQTGFYNKEKGDFTSLNKGVAGISGDPYLFSHHLSVYTLSCQCWNVVNVVIQTWCGSSVYFIFYFSFDLLDLNQ